MLLNTDSFTSKAKVKVEIGFNKHFVLSKARVNFLGDILRETIWLASCFEKCFIFFLILP